jgi:hypothetical protein
MPQVRKSGLTSSRYLSVISSRTITKEHTNFIDGFNTFKTDDNLKDSELRLAQDARITSLGAYKTRQGADFYSDAAGLAANVAQSSTTGASDATFGTISWKAMPFTTTAAGRLTKIQLNLKNANSATGTIIVRIHSNTSGAPGTELARSSIAASTVTGSYAYVDVRFIEAPLLANATQYWIVAYIQPEGTNTYSWSSTTTVTTALTSADSGTTWSSTAYGLNFKTYTSTDSPTLGLYRAYSSTSTKKTLLAHGTSLYTVNDLTGALSSIKTSLSSSATKYRFATANDVVYYVNGFDAPRKWDFTTEAAVGGSPEISSNICLHKGLMFYVSAVDPNKLFFSNFGDYETFTSTDFIEVPAPKTGDPIVALAPLNDALVIWTRYNKYILYGTDNATFTLTQSPGKTGTYSQETVAVDKNFAYFLSDEGLYQFNGTDDKLISDAVYEDLKNLSNKSSACVAVNNDRVYVFYRPAGEVANSSAFVYNLNIGKAESYDTDTYFNHGVTLFQDEGVFVVGSSLVGAAYYLEKASNDYDNLGKDIAYKLRLKYDAFGSPAQDKEIRFWKPRFTAQSGNYSVDCQYAVNLRDVTSTVPNGSVSVQGSGSTFGGGDTWGSGSTYGSNAYVQPDLSVPGQYKYIQLQYSHIAARQPVEFFGDTVRAEVRPLK